MLNVKEVFEKIGGKFIIDIEEFKNKLKNINTIIFDWDGVFNNGVKYGNEGSLFSDIDAMGINIFRFDYWLRNNEMPLIYILTGMTNNSAKKLATREHFNGIYMNSKFKMNIVEKICREKNINPSNIAFVFDDILDLEVAKNVGLSIRVERTSNPLLNNFISENEIGDYITASKGNENAVREICELLTGLNGNYNNAVNGRMKYIGEYEEYLKRRNKIQTIITEIEEPV